MTKFKSERRSRQSRHDPLLVQLREDQLGSGNLSAPGRRDKRPRQEEDRETEIDSKTSKKIFAIAKQQKNEISEEKRGHGSDEDLSELEEDGISPNENSKLTFRQNDDEVAFDSGEEVGGDFDFSDDDDESDDQEVYEEIEIDEGDQAILENFRQEGESRNLANLIMQKLEEHEQQKGLVKKGKAREMDERPDPRSLNPKVIEVYTKVGQLLSRYKSGPLPKAFKILPSLRNWFQILDITSPPTWTPHAVLAATKIFASNLDPKHSQKFYKYILYERIREDIGENKSLSVHLYMALKKAIYKPAAFFKGILFPLCESGTCTLKEAVIVGSVLTKVSIPLLHSSAALLKLSQMDYTGPTSVFIRVLLDKKYALPYKVVDALVFHFLGFKKDPRTMPVLWHQSFLIFAQRYKADLTQEQKDALLELLRAKVHPQITPEIRREIVNSVARGEEILNEDVEMQI